MTIAVGDTLPNATLRRMGPDGPEEHQVSDFVAGKKVAIFGLPGAFTGTCTTAHLPSFMRSEAALREKGVDEIVCLSVNDVFVMQEWAKATGADQSGILMMSDADASFTKALGLEFSAPPVGLVDRCKRCSIVVEDGKVAVLNIDENPGECTISAGDALVDQL